MKKSLVFLLILGLLALTCIQTGCDDGPKNTTALEEQAHTENNQANLLAVQPLPNITWSLERDNLTRRFKLQNDRTISFFMYIFIEGVGTPIGYYQVNKVSSVNSQLSATQQLVTTYHNSHYVDGVIESPAEDGSYGSNGNGVFGFTPEEIYLETNMKYITSTVPLTFNTEVKKLAIINTDEARALLEKSKSVMK